MQASGLKQPTSLSRIPSVANRKRPDTSNDWLKSSTVTSFVRCLHLLNLSQLADWPGVAVGTYSSKTAASLQQRIRCTEWSLYRLFEVYDPKATKDKLKPFFPPLTSLQGVNLRAALYRGLDGLKKAGVLGREIILRKTMLDECKGERFEEVLCEFALIVLKKVAKKQDDRYMDIALADNLTESKQQQLVPLILAHKHAIERLAEHRSKLGKGYASAQLAFAEQSAKLDERMKDARSQAESLPKLTSEQTEAVRSRLATSWTGDERWLDLIQNGVQRAPDVELMSVLRQHGTVQIDMLTFAQSQTSAELLKDLEQRVELQQVRLKKLKSFKQLLDGKVRNSAEHNEHAVAEHTNAEESMLKSQPYFHKHQKLQIAAPGEFAREWSGTEDPLVPLHRSKLEELKSRLAQSHAQGLRANSKASNGLSQRREAPIDEEQADSTDYLNHGKGDKLQVKEASTANEIVVNDVIDGSLTAPQPQNRPPDHHLPPDVEQDRNLQIARAEEETVKVPLPHVSGHVENRHDRLGSDSQHNARLTTRAVIPLGTPSLIERTRQSMAFDRPLKTLDENTTQAPTETIPRRKQPSNVTSPGHARTQSTPSTSTLAERTRQSMLPAQAQAHRRHKSRMSISQANKQVSQQYPINHFGKPEMDIPRDESMLSSNGSTPQNVLLSEDADYASIFKSRPKIAISPQLSPDRSFFDLGGGVEEELQNFEIV